MRRVAVLRNGSPQICGDGGLLKIEHPFRAAIEDEIERLLAILDGLDDDPDLEDGADYEPSLGWSHTMAFGDLSDMEASDALVG